MSSPTERPSGNPRFLAETLRGTAVRLQDGDVVAGGSVSRTADVPPGTIGIEVPPGPVVLRFAGGEAIGEADASGGGSVTFSVGDGCDPVA